MSSRTTILSHPVIITNEINTINERSSMMEGLRIKVELSDHLVAKTALKVLNNQLCENSSGEKEDPFLHIKIRKAIKLITTVANEWWGAPSTAGGE